MGFRILNACLMLDNVRIVTHQICSPCFMESYTITRGRAPSLNPSSIVYTTLTKLNSQDKALRCPLFYKSPPPPPPFPSFLPSFLTTSNRTPFFTTQKTKPTKQKENYFPLPRTTDQKQTIMHTKIFFLTLLFALLTFVLALPSTDATSHITEELDHIPLAAAPYPTDTVAGDNGEVEGLFISGNVTGMDEFSGWYKCETTWGSPSAVDVTGAAIQFDNLGHTRCSQENPSASMCTKMVHFWSYVFPLPFSFTLIGSCEESWFG